MTTDHWILGPGAIGRLLAHSLSPVVAVSLIGRRRLPEQQTLTLTDGERRSQSLVVVSPARLDADTRPSPNFIHITTKAMAAKSALESIARFIAPSTPLVLWQNGYLAQPNLTQTWSGPVFCATTTEGAYLKSDYEVVHAGRGHTFIGTLNHRHSELAEDLAATLTQVGLEATAVSDIRSRLWQKLAVNAAINPLVALNCIHNGKLVHSPYASRVEAVIRELAAVLETEGIAPPNGGASLEAWRALVWGVVESTAANKASMLQDVEARRLTERTAILGPLIESAERHGLACGVLRELNDALATLEADFND